MNELRPFFSYYGGKWSLAKRYPEPEHDIIIEPFAGSAGYSLRYPDRRVTSPMDHVVAVRAVRQGHFDTEEEAAAAYDAAAKVAFGEYACINGV